MRKRTCAYCGNATIIDDQLTCDCEEPATYSTRGYVRLLEQTIDEMKEINRQLLDKVLGDK